MLAPGSKGWIRKYLTLVKKGEVSLELDQNRLLKDREAVHFKLLESGILFGYPNQLIFAEHLAVQKWTHQEYLKVILLESFILIYRQEMGWKDWEEDAFMADLEAFYVHYNVKSFADRLIFFKREGKLSRLEKIFASRLEVKSANIFEGQYWLSYLSNSFIFIDIILFREFLKRRQDVFSTYRDLAYTALQLLIHAAHSDGEVQEQEQLMFNSFLYSSALDEKDRQTLRQQMESGLQLEDLPQLIGKSWLYRRYLMDLVSLMLFAADSWQSSEDLFFDQLCQFLGLPKKESDMALALIDNFVIEHSKHLEYLQQRSTYERMYGSLTKRWIKILDRNKDKLAKELRESKELVFLISKSTREELTKEEKEMVKTQFLDIVKSVPALAIFMLPGGAILLPLILKILPDLIPSAFRDNKID